MYNVFVLFSGDASTGLGLLDGERHGDLYQIVGAATDNEGTVGNDEFLDNDIPVDVLPYRRFCETKELDPRHPDSNRWYHDSVMFHMQEFNPDAVVLSEYGRVLPEKFLQQYPDTRNVRPADLTYLFTPPQKTFLTYPTLPSHGQFSALEVAQKRHAFPRLERAFRGNDAVYDVLAHTPPRRLHHVRSTVHRATPKVDDGPIEVRSAPLPIDWDRVEHAIKRRDFLMLRRYAVELQGELGEKGVIPAMRWAVERAAEGRLTHETRTLPDSDTTYPVVLLDDEELPYGGHSLER